MSNNEAAFPLFMKYEYSPSVVNPGLTKREYFAAAALQGICANPDCSAPTYASSNHDLIARNAYRLADAMLEAAKKGQ